ncbi:MAG: MBL fold metallo-hydrolase [Chloroflexota bacterium]
MLTITLPGTGDAAGIPVHGCDTPSCEEARRYPWLRRLQTCVLVQSKTTSILLDIGNEMHVESLHQLTLDAVFITHLHHDHYAGLQALKWSK